MHAPTDYVIKPPSDSSELPEPPVPYGTDLRKLDGFLLNVDDLLHSELWAFASGPRIGAAKAAVTLWCVAWKQVPTGSLPNIESVVSEFSRCGADWPHVRDLALRGFFLCSDGRLYHKRLCEDVPRALRSHERYLAKRETDAKRLRKHRAQRKRNAAETPNETHPKRDSLSLSPTRNDSLSVDGSRDEGRRKRLRLLNPDDFDYVEEG